MLRLLLILSIFASCFPSFATHMRAGEITYKWVSGLTYKITIVTYTYTPSPADRPDYDVSWGDGTISNIPRIDSASLLPYTLQIRRNTYEGVHTYLGQGTYIISLEDPNRNEGVVNIPYSVNVPFYIQTILVISPFLGPNNSPTLLNPPIDNACVGQPFIHNPGAYDPDGDSLSYRLVICKGEDGLDIPGYTYPTASNYFGINAITGDLLWDSPMTQGEYNVAFLIEEWRSGVLIGYITRDMQITVVTCSNHPPVIEDILDTCVLAGTLLEFDVTATDQDTLNLITLTATGGPLLLTESPANFIQPVSDYETVTSTFSWQTTCSHVQKQPYTMTFKATDSGYPVHLVDLESVFITIVAPAPPNLTASPVGNNIYLEWNISPCPNAIGYKVYRRSGFYGYIHDHCETGVPAYTGYVEIATVTGVDDTTFMDTNNGLGLIHGIDYCYMVIAYFNDGAESYASNEACTTLIKDVPIITNVSINYTDAVNGSAYIAWSKPTVLDTTIATGPYKYLINRSADLAGSYLILIDSLSGLNDTTYIDILINTVATPWSYRIDLWNDNDSDRYLIGSTHVASSVFISLTPGDNQMVISYTPNVPWVNDTFVVFRKDPGSSTFDSIGYSTQLQYTDTGLVNGLTYCYKVKSIGDYFATGFVHPIINWSQETCAVPVDHTPPCPPFLTVTPDCNDVENFLIWTNPNNTCANDVIMYHIYYSPDNIGDFILLATINDPNDTTYLHQDINSIAGCYAVAAVDSFMNESSYSNIVCLDIDSCNLYELPNVFTPDGDGYNDFFIPFPYDFVDHISLQIFNRWGKIIFTTENPDINWDGKNENTHVDCSEGVYFYICDVYEYKLEGLKKRTIQGFIHLLRNN
ncbi:MAG: gliding motility-associated C-terminal domain-containing protein [Bacteroidota bacterium]